MAARNWRGDVVMGDEFEAKVLTALDAIASGQKGQGERIAVHTTQVAAIVERLDDRDIRMARREAQLGAIVERLDDQDVQLALRTGKVDRLQAMATSSLQAAEQAPTAAASLSRSVSRLEGPSDDALGGPA